MCPTGTRLTGKNETFVAWTDLDDGVIFWPSLVRLRQVHTVVAILPGTKRNSLESGRNEGNGKHGRERRVHRSDKSNRSLHVSDRSLNRSDRSLHRSYTSPYRSCRSLYRSHISVLQGTQRGRKSGREEGDGIHERGRIEQTPDTSDRSLHI